MPRRRKTLHLTSLSFVFVMLFLAGLARVPVNAETDQIISSSMPTGQPTIKDPMIVGGVEAQLGDWPWQVALVDAYIPNAYDGQFCGGSLIDPQWVLTAAHCIMDEESGVVDLPVDILAVVGRNRLSSNEGEVIGVSQIIPHENFAETGEEDIALLKLDRPAGLNRMVQSIPLIDPTENALVAPGVYAIVTGWGLTIDGDDSSASDVLRQVELPIISRETCQDAYEDDHIEITNTMICAGEEGKDSCLGDSGGPLVVRDTQDNFKLAGIVSFGHPAGCGTPGTYGVYTRVSPFNAWINSHVESVSVTPGPTPIPTETVSPPQVIVAEVYLPIVSRLFAK